MAYVKSYSVSTDTMTTVLNSNALTIHYNQGDLNTTILNVTLTHQNAAMDLTNATAVSVVFQKADGTVNTQDLTNGITITSATQGQIQIALNTQTISVSGIVLCEAHVTYPNNQVLVTEKFSFNVEATLLSSNAVQGNNSYQVLTVIQVVTSTTSLPTPSSSYRFLPYAVKGATGVAEVDSLTITAAPTASGNVTVTLNGVATTVAVAQGDSTATVAQKISNTTFAGWTTSLNGSTVTFTNQATGAQSAPSYSAGSTGATGNMTAKTAGVTPTADAIYYCKKLSNDTYDWVQTV